MAVLFLESGGSGPGGATGVATATVQAGAIYNGPASGSVTVDTATKNHGYSSLKHDSLASASAYVARLAVLADAGRRISVRMRFTGLGAAAGTGIIRALTSGAATNWEVRLDSAGKLRLYAGASGTTLVQTGATTLSTATWYRISVAYTITSAGVNQFRVYLDGALELTGTNVASSVTATSVLRIGWTGTTPGANVVMHSQDLYVDDSTALTDPGDVRVTAKRPAALGATNAFDTLVGTGTNRYDRVSERPINTANGMTQAATALVREQFAVEAAAVGDDDLTGASVLAWAGWTHFSVVAAAGSTLATPVVNGVDQAYTTVAASGAYQTTYHLIASTSYPSGNTAIGLKSTGSAVDTLLRECGVLIAYTMPVTTTLDSVVGTIDLASPAAGFTAGVGVSAAVSDLALGGLAATAIGTTEVPWTPADLAPRGWWDAAAITGLADADPVASWPDSAAGTPYPLTQATALKRPTYQTGELNGLAVVDFSGSQCFQVAHSFGITAQPYSVYAVWKAANAANQFLIHSTAPAGNDPGAWINGSGNLATHGGADVATAITKAAYRMTGHVINGASSVVVIDGNTRVTGNAGAQAPGNTNTAVGALETGASLFLTGQIAEMLVLPSAATQSDEHKIFGYFAHKWGLTASLPAGHPYKTAPPTVPVTVTSVTGVVADLALNARTHALGAGVALASGVNDLALASRTHAVTATTTVSATLTAVVSDLDLDARSHALAAGAHAATVRGDLAFGQRAHGLSSGTGVTSVRNDLALGSRTHATTAGQGAVATTTASTLALDPRTHATRAAVALASTAGPLALDTRSHTLLGTGGLTLIGARGDLALGSRQHVTGGGASLGTLRGELAAHGQPATCGAGAGLSSVRGTVALDGRSHSLIGLGGTVLGSVVGALALDARTPQLGAGTGIVTSAETVTLATRSHELAAAAGLVLEALRGDLGLDPRVHAVTAAGGQVISALSAGLTLDPRLHRLAAETLPRVMLVVPGGPGAISIGGSGALAISGGGAGIPLSHTGTVTIRRGT